MQNHKEVCGDKKCVWFTVERKEGKKFLQWVKNLGCVWIDGKKIKPQNNVDFFHLSINKDGKLSYVPMSAWLTKQPEFKDVQRYDFKEYIKDITISRNLCSKIKQ